MNEPRGYDPYGCPIGGDPVTGEEYDGLDGCVGCIAFLILLFLTFGGSIYITKSILEIIKK